MLSIYIITSLPPSLRNAQENHQIVEGCSCSQMVMCGFSKTNSGGSGPTGWPVYVPTVRWICSPCNPMGFWTNQLPGITTDPLTSRCQVVHARQRLRVVFPQPDKYGEQWQPSHSDEDHWLGIFPGTRGWLGKQCDKRSNVYTKMFRTCLRSKISKSVTGYVCACLGEMTAVCQAKQAREVAASSAGHCRLCTASAWPSGCPLCTPKGRRDYLTSPLPGQHTSQVEPMFHSRNGGWSKFLYLQTAILRE